VDLVAAQTEGVGNCNTLISVPVCAYSSHLTPRLRIWATP
jgi:hypothetical protein